MAEASGTSNGGGAGVFSVATWNVNSLRVRLPQVLAWLRNNPVDALCLQETKMSDAVFPADDFQSAGYYGAHHGQGGYNGVAIIARRPPRDVACGIPDFDDPQARVISADVGGARLVCVYVPNGQEVGAAKYRYKLRWLAALRAHLKAELKTRKQLAVLGDFNIAPADADVFDPEAWGDEILCSPPERHEFQEIESLGFTDAFRLFPREEKIFSWWDYRQNSFKRNRGLRIDLIMLSQALTDNCRACEIDKTPRRHERPSDHAPVIAEIAV
jgi:exodeoxyribonuclease-3